MGCCFSKNDSNKPPTNAKANNEQKQGLMKNDDVKPNKNNNINQQNTPTTPNTPTNNDITSNIEISIQNGDSVDNVHKMSNPTIPDDIENETNNNETKSNDNINNTNDKNEAGIIIDNNESSDLLKKQKTKRDQLKSLSSGLTFYGTFTDDNLLKTDGSNKANSSINTSLFGDITFDDDDDYPDDIDASSQGPSIFKVPTIYDDNPDGIFGDIMDSKDDGENTRLARSKSTQKRDRASKVKKIEEEIVMSERTYLDGLKTLMNEFLQPIFDNKYLDRDRYELRLKSNLPILLQFHEQFYLELFQNKNSIEVVFKEQCHFFKMYQQYINNYELVLGLFGSNEFKRNKKLQKFIDDKMMKESKPIANYLILPIQRVPRYMLLLTELKKSAKKEIKIQTEDLDLINDEQDITGNVNNKLKTQIETELNKLNKKLVNLEEALQNITQICDQINEKKREIENITQCLTIQNQLKDLTESIIVPHRRFIKQFTFVIKKKGHGYSFFVFNDLVIIANIKNRVKVCLQIKTIDLNINNKRNEFEINYKNKSKTMFTSDDIKAVNEFEDLVLKSKKKIKDTETLRLSMMSPQRASILAGNDSI